MYCTLFDEMLLQARLVNQPSAEVITGKSSKHKEETHSLASSTELANTTKRGMHKTYLCTSAEWPTANHCKQAYLMGFNHQRVVPCLVIPERVGHDIYGEEYPYHDRLSQRRISQIPQEDITESSSQRRVSQVPQEAILEEAILEEAVLKLIFQASSVT